MSNAGGGAKPFIASKISHYTKPGQTDNILFTFPYVVPILSNPLRLPDDHACYSIHEVSNPRVSNSQSSATDPDVA
jgi:hypothetical protein